MASDRAFELGLVMAGAISAGAYTAGVLDFLFEALDAYNEEKREARWTARPTTCVFRSCPAPRGRHDFSDLRPGSVP